MLQGFVEDVSDPASQKVAVIFFSRCVTIWGRPLPGSPDAAPNGDHKGNQGLPGFERFIYERLIPTAFRVPSLPNFNPKDGQMMVVSLIYTADDEEFIRFTGFTRNRKFATNHLLYSTGGIYIFPKCVFAFSKLASRNGCGLYHKTSHSGWKEFPKILHGSHTFLPFTIVVPLPCTLARFILHSTR